MEQIQSMPIDFGLLDMEELRPYLSEDIMHIEVPPRTTASEEKGGVAALFYHKTGSVFSEKFMGKLFPFFEN